MKTAQEWLAHHKQNAPFATSEAELDALLKREFETIQRDAELEGWKRGMTDAASIWVDRERELSPVGLARKALSELRDKIKAKRDFKT